MLEAREGQADALAEILEVMTPPTMAEPGVKLFLPYRSPTNPLLFFIFELYVNEAAWGAHEATDHFKTALAQLLPRVTRRERALHSVFRQLKSWRRRGMARNRKAYSDEYHAMNFFSPSTLKVTARERGPRTAQLFASARARTAAPMAPPR
jgi:quinol monooxygenase YgiN